MLFAIKDGIKIRPSEKGQSAKCPTCDGEVRSVIPIKNIAHWRHKAFECDTWSEGETQWHLGWKERFEPDECEVSFQDPDSGELHRADVCVNSKTYHKCIVEFQNSPISQEEQVTRETFYQKQGMFYWVLNVDIDRSKSFRGINFSFSLGFDRPQLHQGRTFYQMDWFGRSKQWIDRWKSSNSHVLLSYQDHLFYLATTKSCRDIVNKQGKGEFSLLPLTMEAFIDSLRR